MRWTVVVPVKVAPSAKSRLRAPTRSARAHATLTAAIRSDTLAAAGAAASVARILVVADGHEGPSAPPDTHLLVQRSPGLNRALAEAADYAADRWPDDGIALLVGDLPALRPADLDAALARAAGHPAAFVADADGSGTTLLTALPGAAIAPRFGAGSALRHAEAATAVAAPAGLRRDVDTDADLVAALALGVGPATAAVLGVDPGHGSQAVAG